VSRTYRRGDDSSDPRRRNGHDALRRAQDAARIARKAYGQVPRNALQPGTVLEAHVPYWEDATESKARPVIVVAVHGGKITVLACYSSASASRRPGAYRLVEWAAAGLSRPSTVAAATPRCIDLLAVSRHLGHLDPVDLVSLGLMPPGIKCAA
jgi:hypothetical protein